jgi:hypothetical protein
MKLSRRQLLHLAESDSQVPPLSYTSAIHASGSNLCVPDGLVVV